MQESWEGEELALENAEGNAQENDLAGLDCQACLRANRKANVR